MLLCSTRSYGASFCNVRFGPKADMSCAAHSGFRFVPIADICLFDDLVSAPDQCMGNNDLERLGSLEIYDQFDFCGLLDW